MLKLLIAAVPTIFAVGTANAQTLPDPLSAYASPLREAAPADGACDLGSLLDATAGATVIGLGEPTHGTAEVFRLKHCAIQTLVERGNVRHIVFEMSVGEGADLNDYIAGNRDDLGALLNGLPLWMFQVEEFAEVLRWLRAHNENAVEPVSVYGMEAQYADRSARHALEYLRRLDPDGADELTEIFGPERIASATASATDFAFLYTPISDAAFAAYQNLFLRLRSAFERQKDELVAATGEAKFLEAQRHVAALGQFTSLALLEDDRAQAQLRDYVMAVNVDTIVNRAKDGERVVIWGHNEHIWKQVGNGGYDVAGRQLARWYGSEYYAIGFDFGQGAYRAPGEDGWVHEVGSPQPASFTAALAQAGDPDLFLDLRAAAKADAGEAALSGEFTVRASAGGYVPTRDGQRVYDQTISLIDRYDGMFFVATSTPTKTIAQ